MIERIKRACPCCASTNAQKLEKYSHPDWATLQCEDCGFIYLADAPVYEALSEDLAWTKQFEKEKIRRKEKSPVVAWIDQKTRWRLHMFRDNEWEYICEKVKGGNVLDVGCGSNNKVPETFTPFGIEIEKEAAEQAQEAMGVAGGKVVHAPALEGMASFEDNTFDGIIMRSYLEHETNPKDVLDEAMRILRPGGVIYVKVPNFGTVNRAVRGREWCGFRFPDHLNYFTIGSLRNMAERAGYAFQLKNVATRFTNDNMHCFLTKPAH